MNPHQSPPRDANARPLILAVDDVLENRFIVQRRLERMGYDCILADSGPAALNMIRAMSPHLVLLDFMMPGMDGIMVLRELRASPATVDLPVIMLTARTDGDSIVSALDEGADDYVVKPIDFAVLKARVDVSLLRRELTLSLAEANSRLDARAAAQAIELGEVRELLHGEFQRTHHLQDALRRSSSVPQFNEISSCLRRVIDLCGMLDDATDFHAIQSAAHEIRTYCSAALNPLHSPAA